MEREAEISNWAHLERDSILLEEMNISQSMREREREREIGWLRKQNLGELPRKSSFSNKIF